MCCEEAFPVPGLWGDKDLILVGALFPLDGRKRREEKKKKNCLREGRFPQDWTHLAGCAVGCSC
jgi:hypothetical protein